jgi:cellulose synthase/poly-beta-1,6-N-acetylglucosamine synthase-like glycosyltransferase
MPAFSIPFFIYLLLGLGSAMYILELALFYLPILVSNKWKQAADDATPISIIISARDEHRNLSAHLDAWLTQKHSCYEVIVVNDCSYDDTQHLLSEYERKYPHFRSIQMHETTLFKGGKKIALTLGIKGAQFERLLFTDADCYPRKRPMGG